MAEVNPTGFKIDDKTVLIVLGSVVVLIIILWKKFPDLLPDFLKGFLNRIEKNFVKPAWDSSGIGAVIGTEERGNSQVQYSMSQNHLTDDEMGQVRNLAHKFGIPEYVIFRIGMIESALNRQPAIGSCGEIGTFQITNPFHPLVSHPLFIDFINAVRAGHVQDIPVDTILNEQWLSNPINNATVSAWKLGNDYAHYWYKLGFRISATVRAYNGGRGNAGDNDVDTQPYWDAFNSDSLKVMFPKD